MELRKINKNDAKAQWEYTTALPTDENGLTNPYNGVSYNEGLWQRLNLLFMYLPFVIVAVKEMSIKA
jgi:hypothetical protein